MMLRFRKTGTVVAAFGALACAALLAPPSRADRGSERMHATGFEVQGTWVWEAGDVTAYCGCVVVESVTRVGRPSPSSWAMLDVSGWGSTFGFWFSSYDVAPVSLTPSDRNLKAPSSFEFAVQGEAYVWDAVTGEMATHPAEIRVKVALDAPTDVMEFRYRDSYTTMNPDGSFSKHTSTGNGRTGSATGTGSLSVVGTDDGTVYLTIPEGSVPISQYADVYSSGGGELIIEHAPR